MRKIKKKTGRKIKEGKWRENFNKMVEKLPMCNVYPCKNVWKNVQQKYCSKIEIKYFKS